MRDSASFALFFVSFILFQTPPDHVEFEIEIIEFVSRFGLVYILFYIVLQINTEMVVYERIPYDTQS